MWQRATTHLKAGGLEGALGEQRLGDLQQTVHGEAGRQEVRCTGRRFIFLRRQS